MTHKQGALTMLRDMSNDLPLSEKKVAEYILEKPQEVINLTAAEIGKYSGTSSAAVVRLCKSLGLKGLQDLKMRIHGDMKKNDSIAYRDIKADESQESVVQKITNNNIKSIMETSEIMNFQALSEAVDAMLAAQTVCFFGIGASGVVAKDAQQKFIRINKNSQCFEDQHLTATVIGNMKYKDVMMGISYSGETLEVIKLLKFAKDNGITTISLTKYGKTSLSEIADINLFTSSCIEVPFRSAATSSRMAQLHVMDILFICVATRQYDDTIKYLDQTRKATDIFREGR